MRILVTGSRDWTDPEAVEDAIMYEALHGEPPYTIVHGACPTGADAHADAVGRTYADLQVERHPADWKTHGKAAGFRRNAQMVDLGADVCLAFIRNGSRGASHTAALAEKADIPTKRFTACACGCPAAMHVGEIGCPCGLPNEPPCTSEPTP